jgi:hypothetical protein
LGHIILVDGIVVDPRKIKFIRGWTTPINVIEVISFMGLIGYYRRFIKGFSKIASLVTPLQNKGVKFEWTPKCDESFHQPKYILTKAPILKIIDSDEDFVVWTNACKEGLGGVLTQSDHVVCYESQKLKNMRGIMLLMI